MKKIISSVVAALLMLTSTSLSAQRTSEYWLSYTSKLPIGSTVRVRTTDGKRITAVLAVVDETGISLEPKTRVPEPPRHIRFDELQQVELKPNGTSAVKAALIGVGAGVGAFFAVVAIFAAAWD